MKRVVLLALFFVLVSCVPAAEDEPRMITPPAPVLGTPESYPLPTVAPPALKTTSYPPSPSEFTPVPTINPQDDILPALRPARDYLARRLGIAPAAIQVAAYEQTDFMDGCLGLPHPGEMCAQVITPGYIVTFRTDLGNFIFHIARNGYPFRMAGENYEIQDK